MTWSAKTGEISWCTGRGKGGWRLGRKEEKAEGWMECGGRVKVGGDRGGEWRKKGKGGEDERKGIPLNNTACLMFLF